MARKNWKTINSAGSRRVVVTKELCGEHWLQVLQEADCRIEICLSDNILTIQEIAAAVGVRCDGVIGQLTEDWGVELFSSLRSAGVTVYSNYAVGYNNIDRASATAAGIPVGNTPGVLTETTAEMAVALTFCAARRVGEAERFLRQRNYRGWLPNLLVGELLNGKTVGIIGAGRIGSAYARMMVEGHKMNVIYFDLLPNNDLERFIVSYSEFNIAHGGRPLFCRRVEHVDELLAEADCVSIHTVLDDSTYHLINGDRLKLMKEDAILINTSRGPVIDEAALVAHAAENPNFKASLDVFEEEPDLADGLTELDNIVAVPHIASATQWTRSGMASLAACNVAGLLQGYPAWNRPDIEAFLSDTPPRAAPSIVNAKELGIPLLQ